MAATPLGNQMAPGASFDLLDFLARDEVGSVLVSGRSISGFVRATAVDRFPAGIRPFGVANVVSDRDAAAVVNALRDLRAEYAEVINSATAFADRPGAHGNTK